MKILINNKYLQRFFFPIILVWIIIFVCANINGFEQRNKNKKDLENAIVLLEKKFGYLRKKEVRSYNFGYAILWFEEPYDYNKKLLELNFKKNGNLFCYKNISININYEKGVPYFIYFRNNPDCSVIK
ncbi:hypothetical protein JP35_06680 [Gallibacterium anatis]|uniref:Uncharacterized protein n=1 Tax=Gallibacterium anatis TaxID=750 RepID=A0A0A2XPB8_9PAST|nr:hypothetical protein [Gallibacterium anatis]KGQ34156.1 hypothetical protein JP32_00950 [Gallibacterium anatis]KGQ39179.1 hypothetical protein JP35_06680 [Gallibacterium anatis]